MPPPTPSYAAPALPAPSTTDYPPSASYGAIQAPQGDFTFTVNKPAGIQDARYDSYVPTPTTHGPQYSHAPHQEGRDSYVPHHGRTTSYAPNEGGYAQRNAQYGSNRQRGGHNGPRGPHGGRLWKPFKAAERELLQGYRQTAPERALFDPTAGTTFKHPSDVFDTGAGAEISGLQISEPPHKRARLDLDHPASGNSAPKWSNPDRYTAVAGEDASLNKKKDVVRLIRNARVESGDHRAPPADTEDFISCDFESDDDDKARGRQPQDRAPPMQYLTDLRSPVTLQSPVSFPIAARGSQPGSRGRAVPAQFIVDDAPSSRGRADPAQFFVEDGPGSRRRAVPAQFYVDDAPPASAPTPRSRKRGGSIHKWHNNDFDLSAALGSRKRTHDDRIKLPEHAKLKKVNRMPGRGALSLDWVPIDSLTPCPWVRDYSGSANTAMW